MKTAKIGHVSVKSERSKHHYFILCGKRDEKENLPSKLKSTVEPPLMDTRLMRTPHYYRQFALSLGKALPYIFSKFNPLNTDTFYGPSVSILIGFYRTTYIYLIPIKYGTVILTSQGLMLLFLRDDNTPLQLTFSYSKDPKSVTSFN